MGYIERALCTRLHAYVAPIVTYKQRTFRLELVPRLSVVCSFVLLFFFVLPVGRTVNIGFIYQKIKPSSYATSLCNTVTVPRGFPHEKLPLSAQW
jgi:hypothetical protein